jgi:hypothetical protein
MAHDQRGTADTNMMRIVHNALRRDLRDPPPDDRQRGAIAEHLAWSMAFLEAHHRAEDPGLHPVVRERDRAHRCACVRRGVTG